MGFIVTGRLQNYNYLCEARTERVYVHCIAEARAWSRNRRFEKSHKVEKNQIAKKPLKNIYI